MDWHTRYTQQATWTRELRNYLFQQTGLKTAGRVLEVGCGTGAILNEVQTKSLHGLDIQSASLMEARVNIPSASLTCSNALFLPYPNDVFDIAICHYLLLWVSDPQQALYEMKRDTVRLRDKADAELLRERFGLGDD